MPVDKVREIMRVAQEPVSLETPIGEEEDSHLGDFIPDEDAPVPAEAASHTLLKEQLSGVLKSLTPREEKVLRLRFGLEDGRPRTLEEVGKEFNVTRERIRQIEARRCVSCATPAVPRSCAISWTDAAPAFAAVSMAGPGVHIEWIEWTLNSAARQNRSRAVFAPPLRHRKRA